MANTLEHFAFDPPEGLESREYSPTYPESEEAIRAQLQGIPNQLRDKLNALIDILSDETTDASGADHIGAGEIPGFSSRRVGGQLRELYELVRQITLGAIPDGAITTEKLAAQGVTTETIMDQAVTTEKIADGAITAEKLAGGGLTDDWFTAPPTKYASGSYTGTGKFGSGNPLSLTFDFKPLLVYIINTTNRMIRAVYNTAWLTSSYISHGYDYSSQATPISDSSQYARVVGNTLSWYSSNLVAEQMNSSGVSYAWIAIGV